MKSPQQQLRKRKSKPLDSGAEIDKNGDQEHEQSFRPKMANVLLTWVVVSIVLASIILVVIPLAFRFSSNLQRKLLFMNFLNLHSFYNHSNPSEFGLDCSISFNIITSDNVSLALWHIPPNESSCLEAKRTDNNESKLNNGQLVVLYAHGNGGTRGVGHRVALYKLLSNQLSAHVIAFDYRGFGDSSNVEPSKTGISNDTYHIYKWIVLQNDVSPKKVLFWGHSLGTAAVLYSLKHLALSDGKVLPPGGAVLEAPFTSLSEVIYSYPLSRVFRFLPYFRYCFVDPLVNDNRTNFNNTSKLPYVHSPLLILHAQDDIVIPFEIGGQKLYKQAVGGLLPEKEANKSLLVLYDGKYGYGHRNIYHDPNLIQTLNLFIKQNEMNLI